MRDLSRVDVRKVLKDTWTDFGRELQGTPLPHFNESVFRFLFVRSLLRRYPTVRCETEWKRMDLLFLDAQGPSVVEFKFYIYNIHRNLWGNEQYYKGGAGDKNFSEFCYCVKKLADLDSQRWGRDRGASIVNRYLVLAYADSKERTGERSYRHWYDRLDLPSDITKRAQVTRYGRTGITTCPSTQHRLRSVVFRVQSNGT